MSGSRSIDRAPEGRSGDRLPENHSASAKQGDVRVRERERVQTSIGLEAGFADRLEQLVHRDGLRALRTDVQQLSGAALGERESPDEGEVSAGSPTCLLDRRERASLCRPSREFDHLAPVPPRPVPECRGQLGRREGSRWPPGTLDNARAGGCINTRLPESPEQDIDCRPERGRRQPKVGGAGLADTVDREEGSLGHDDEDGMVRRGVPQFEEAAGGRGRHRDASYRSDCRARRAHVQKSAGVARSGQ